MYKYSALCGMIAVMVSGSFVCNAHGEETPENVLAEKQFRRGRPRPGSSCTVELTFALDDPEIKPVVLPFKYLKKHKGNVDAASKDLRIARKRKRIKRAYDSLHKKVQEFDASFTLMAGDVTASIDAAMTELKDPTYAPLLCKVLPELDEVARDFKAVLGKSSKLLKQLLHEIKTNEPLAAILGTEKASCTELPK